LQPQEDEPKRLIASGKSLNEIAALLSLSDKTISTYRARILEKIGLKSNAELIRYAIQNDLVD
jgi:two-component system, NarL family, invasion response regulator UvrY